MTFPLLADDEIPAHQKELINFLKGFKYSKGLQDIALRYRFTEEETRRFKDQWGKWLKPIEGTSKEKRHARNLG